MVIGHLRAVPRLLYDTATAQWKLVAEATLFVTGPVVVWTGVKSGGADPTGVYARTGGCDSTSTLTVEAV